MLWKFPKKNHNTTLDAQNLGWSDYNRQKILQRAPTKRLSSSQLSRGNFDAVGSRRRIVQRVPYTHSSIDRDDLSRQQAYPREKKYRETNNCTRLVWNNAGRKSLVSGYAGVRSYPTIYPPSPKMAWWATNPSLSVAIVRMQREETRKVCCTFVKEKVFHDLGWSRWKQST